MKKIYEVQSSEYVAEEKGITVRELFKNEPIYFNCRGSLTVKEFPNAILMLDYDSMNEGKVIEIGAGGKAVGNFKRIKWSDENKLKESDTWRVEIDTDLIEHKGDSVTLKKEDMEPVWL
jgi:hypothetical protein